ncbi:MAG: hypothetical protein JNK23_08565 [Opitutaceae bacterium]|nr:hypothetical protein [Opitutaceae bacterium]
MSLDDGAASTEGAITHPRWSRSEESRDFFLDEDRLRLGFRFLAIGGVVLLVALGAGLWRLHRAALAPPKFVGILHGLIFSGPPESLVSVRESDFDLLLTDIVEVAFSRTEKGLPDEVRYFCAANVITQIDQAYRENALKYPAGYVQTMMVQETRSVAQRTGHRHLRYRGLLSSRSVSAAQTSAIYLDCVFEIGPPAGTNTIGWRLQRVDAITREAFYTEERERARREALNLPASAEPGKERP